MLASKIKVYDSLTLCLWASLIFASKARPYPSGAPYKPDKLFQAGQVDSGAP